MRNFLVMGTQRTGSSAIAEGLGLHPDVVCGYEWTQRVSPIRAIKIADVALARGFHVLSDAHRTHVIANGGDTKKVLGFRRLFRSSDKWLLHPVLAPALWRDRFMGHLQWLARRPDIAVVHVVRTRNMDWLKSKALSRSTGAYFGRLYDPQLSVEIDPREAVKRAISKDFVDRNLHRLKATNQYLCIEYEEFFLDRRAVLERTLEFLGVESARLPALAESMTAVVQSTKSAAESISNFEEIEKALSDRNLLRARLGQ